MIIVLALAVAGCAAIALKPGAERVKLTNQQPQGCEYLGEVMGSQGSSLTSANNLAEGARNDLKNKAFEKGANAVHVLISRDGHTMGGQMTSSSIEGVAYRCPTQSEM